ncbi:GNAT family N-acetyltransferase [Nocardioides sp. GY 10113]|uniref:GNAT family N-acetyltransferase n=1 Tax=Nocardioides sp. GY 10113 TaxID=2569761 RepID=UPI0010A8C581|nr:GNAT family N-acetyltransferase [Nocardioides sp. GY 10113]TIC88630.1 GNAT family N-acetyltransferase [Nocardioides sp. GY 10113]
MTSTDPGRDPGRAHGRELDVVLRPAYSGDLTELGELHWAARVAAVPTMPPPAHPRAEVIAHFAALDLAAPGVEAWVAEDDRGLVGFAVVREDWLEHLYVRPEAQSEGVGSALLGLVQGLRPRGFGLWVFESNAPARRFYARHGLVEVERTDGSDNEERSPDIHVVWRGARAAVRGAAAGEP